MLTIYLAMVETKEQEYTVERIYNTHGVLMKKVIFEELKDTTETEAVLHETFVSLISNLTAVEKLTPDKEKAYVLAAAKNHARSYLRKQNRYSEFSETYSAADDDGGIESFLSRQFSKEAFNIAVAAIRDMEEPYKEVLIMHYVMHMKDTAIAKNLGRNINTVRSQIRRGKNKLIAELKRKGIE